MDLSTIYNEIIEAKERISPYLLKTPLLHSNVLSNLSQGDVYLKLESEQYTGSFKARGSLNKLLWLRETGKTGIPVTASTGNHGLGFARALNILGMEGRIYLPKSADPSKKEAIRRYGIEIELINGDPYETEIYTRKMAEEKGWIYISPYNDLQVLAGQGTIGPEITDELKLVDSLMATVGGGGLISGIAAWFREKNPDAGIIGCQPENSPEMSVSVSAGEYRQVESRPTLSDGSAGGFEKDSITFDLCKMLVDEFILVSEEEIRNGILFCLDKHKKLVEGSSGVAVASFLKDPERFKDQKTVIVICGANISVENLKKVLC